MPRFCFACIGFFLLLTSSYADEGVYKVTYVYDGDTVKLRPINSSNPNDDIKLRLSDIDAPERNQDFGLKSRRALIALCQGNNIVSRVQISGTDKYQRALGKMQCNSIDAAYYQAEHGYAWYYAKYSNNAEVYQAAKKARKLGIGLWAKPKPIPPWIWRHEHSHQ